MEVTHSCLGASSLDVEVSNSGSLPTRKNPEIQKGRATGGQPPSLDCAQPGAGAKLRAAPPLSARTLQLTQARDGERTIVATAEAARRVPGLCPRLPEAAAAEIWLSYYSPPSTVCVCECARVSESALLAIAKRSEGGGKRGGWRGECV